MTDEAISTPAVFAFEKVSVAVTDIKSEIGSKLGLLMNANVRSGGSIALDGSLGLQPIEGAFSFNLNELALEAANPYIEPFAAIQLTSGYLSINGDSNVSLEGDTPVGNFKGRIALTDLKVVEKELGQDLVSLMALEVSGIEADLEPMAVKIESITLRDPRATVLINEDGTINLMQALGIESEVDESGEVTETPAEATEDMEASGLPFPVSIGSITLENVGAILTDRSISPAVNLGLETLSGTISGLSSEELARADLDLKGTLTGGTQMAITGKINPLIEDRYSDVEMSFQGFNLTAVSPYSGKFVGYALDKGKLSFDLKYKISQSEMTGENVMIIDQLTLGDKVESEDALKLPIPLAVSLMKDRNGVIEIDIPVSGNLNDPEFGLGRVITRAIVNVITKLITSPFSMLGGLIPGGSDVDLSQISYVPAAKEFDNEATKTLELLADALKERPTLRLEIVGGAGGPAEVNKLKQNLFEDKLKTFRWKELQGMGSTGVTLEQVALTDSDRIRITTEAFNELFPEEAVNSITQLEPVTTTRQPPSAPETATKATETADTLQTDEEPSGLTGFFRRIFGGNSAPADADPVAEVAERTSPESSQETTTPPESVVAKPTLSPAQMEARIIETIEVSSEYLATLADSRAEAVRAFLETTGEIPGERLFVIAPEDPASISSSTGEPKVTFKLE
jgi:hypothetical protein